jgi:hypothetical protein
LRAGVPAGSRRTIDLAERHRQHIGRWFYDCDHRMHRGLAEMYLADERSAKNYDNLAPGLARYVHDAMLVRERLVVKLPAGRIDALIEAGEGVRFDANKGTTKSLLMHSL